MIVLALDTCLGACSAAVLAHDKVAAVASEPMSRGHQERLAALVGEVMVQARVGFDAVDRIGVTIGPGSFTGLRVGLAFAKGLALALDRPCIGVGTLEALAAGHGHRPRTAAVIDAGRGRVYLQIFDGGVALSAPRSLPVDVAAAQIAEAAWGAELLLVGPGAGLISEAAPGLAWLRLAAPRAEWVARIAAGAPRTPPEPLYLRAPDARRKGQ
jgi:tRNA threonylcarbamoyladenosine biosynthesis protein TsaB